MESTLEATGLLQAAASRLTKKAEAFPELASPATCSSWSGLSAAGESKLSENSAVLARKEGAAGDGFASSVCVVSRGLARA